MTIPQTTIYLLTGVPIDETYDHTLYFPDASTQNAYFRSKGFHSLTAYSYQRAGSDVIKVQIPAEQIYQCNYLMFQNTGFGTVGSPAKWFYAFVTEVEYINDETSAIHYSIDLLQTWFFDFTLDYCFVERNHTPTDIIGAYLEPEPVNPGEYVCNGSYIPLKADLTDMGVIVSVCQLTDNYAGGKIYDGVFGASILTYYNTSTAAGRESLNSYLASFKDSPSAINGIYMVPKAMIPAAVRESTWAALDNYTSGQSYTVNGPALTGSETIAGYGPVKNKKLFTYPYNFYNVDNANGATLTLRYEFFDRIGGSFTPSFKILGNLTQPVRVVLRPFAYKRMTGSGGAEDPAVDNLETITLENYPLCSWAIDAYNAWVAQNAVPEAIKGIGTTLAGALIGASGLMTGGAGALGAGALASAVGGTLSKMYSASISADITAGNFNNGSVNCSIGTQNFYGGRFSVTAERARCIDDFFTRFGYAMNRLMIPFTHTRPKWNYVKTAGCTITGSIPSDAARKICRIHDAGVTYWQHPSEVGNYGLDNSPQNNNQG